MFVLPTLLAFIIGFIWPFIWGIYLSFQRFTTVSKTTFVGIQNYINVFQDSTFLHAFGFTAAFTVVSTVLINVCAFAIALVLTRGIRGTDVYKRQDVSRYCSLKTTPIHDNYFFVDDMIEKPKKGQEFSNYSILGRVLLTPEIYEILAHTKPGAGGEIQLTDAMAEYARTLSLIHI